jgi:hypothetical protein
LVAGKHQALGHFGGLQFKAGLHACQVNATFSPAQEAPLRHGFCNWSDVGRECGGAQTRMLFAAFNKSRVSGR